jgi:hypothetical protein
MRTDPSSRGVQEFYLIAADDNARHTEITECLAQSKRAMQAGRRAEAVDWARKAALMSGDPKDLEALASFEGKIAALPPQEDAAKVSKKTKPEKEGFPLWPIGAVFGITALGYGLYRAKQTTTSEEGLDPNPKVPPGQARRNYLLSAIGVGALLVAVALWEFGPPAWTAVRAFLATMGPTGAEMSLQQVGAGGTGSASGGAIALNETAATAAKAGLATGGVYAGVKTVSDGISYASADGPNGSGSKPAGTVDPTLEDLVNAGEQPDRNGLTKAGRALQKHGHRQGSAFPRANGRERNEMGRKVLRDIVANPKSGKRMGQYLDIISPDGRGARFTPDGNRFIGFLEP